MTAFGDGGLDLPFEEQAPTYGVPLDGGMVASGVVLMAGFGTVPGHGVVPCLIYRFAKPDGSGFYPPITLIVASEQMAGLVKLTADATAAAILAADGAS